MKKLQGPKGIAGYVVLGGALLLLLVGLASLADTSGSGCGRLIAGRYSVPAMIVTVGLFVSGGLGLWAALYWTEPLIRTWLGRLFLVGLGVGFSLVLGEGMLRVFNPLRSVEDVRLINHDVLGQARKPLVVINATDPIAGEWHSMHEIDDQGLYIRGKQPNVRDDSARRILMVGDSFLEGLSVSDTENMSEVLERGLTEDTDAQFQVINVGLSSYDATTYLLSYRVYKDQFDPEIVVATFYIGNDFTSAARRYYSDQVILDEDGNPIAMQPRFDLENLTAWEVTTARPEPMNVREGTRREGILLVDFLKDNTIFRLCQALQERNPSQIAPRISEERFCADLSGELTRSCTNNYLLRNETLIRNNPFAIFKDSYSELDMEDIEVALRPLAILNDEVTEDGRTLLVVIIPVKAQVPGQAGPPQAIGLVEGETITSTQPQDTILAFCDAEGLTCLDLLPILKSREGQYFWRHDPHFTPEGHLVTGEAIEEALLPLLDD